MPMLNAENTYGKKVVTRLSAVPVFYPAEDYHQNFHDRNPEQSYCSFSIPPKIEKLESRFAAKLKQA